MIYFDTCYIVKCYVAEVGCEKVRRLTESGESVGSCEFGRAEFFAAVHRHYREGHITGAAMAAVFRRLRADERAGHWTWFPVTSQSIEACAGVYEALPPSVFLRTADALHLSCAKTNGFKILYTHDARMAKAAPFFALKALDVISGENRP